MPSVFHALKTKGFKKTIRRGANYLDRYGFTSQKMTKNILDFVDLIKKNDAKVTFPITAKTLEKHSDFIKNITDANVEFAVHGYTHIDYTKQNAKFQNDHITKAVALFKDIGIRPYGFRGPYLQANDDTLKAIKENDLIYDSSASILWNIVPEHYIMQGKKSYNLAKKLYNCNSSNISSPYMWNNLVRIPVTLPDDEMLIDRLNIKNQRLIAKIWSKILCKSYEQGGSFVLQLHPERLPFALGALEEIIVEANKKEIWITSLKELATYWMNNGKFKDCRSVLCITGDIDIISLWDF
jgi:peptidoglycan/xylan/chitin deacetylase (PgdA/CDA1 family)